MRFPPRGTALVGWLSIGVRAVFSTALRPQPRSMNRLRHLSSAAVPPTCVPFGGTMADKAVLPCLNTTYAKIYSQMTFVMRRV